MMNRKCLLGLFSFFFITTIFAERNRVLWDFGVVIKSPTQQKGSKITIENLTSSRMDSHSQVKALIANPFISPTTYSLGKILSDAPKLLGGELEIRLSNIPLVKLLAGRLTIENNYQSIIDIINQVDFNSLNENDCIDLYYWLANAYFNTGNYIEAENIILTKMRSTIDDRFHFLLAMNYEAQGKIRSAHTEYLKFINQFPQSDYKMSALIKSRILDRFK